MRFLKSALPLAAALAFSALLSACRTPAPDAFDVEQSAAGHITHRHSRFSFPPRVGFFTRQDVFQYDKRGEDVSVSYQAGALIDATVYVYPARRRSLERELETRIAEILAVHPGGRLHSQRTQAVTPQRTPGKVVEFSFTEPYAGSTQTLRSELILTKRGSRFLKYRFTYPESHAERSRQEIEKFVAAFDWPQ